VTKSEKTMLLITIIGITISTLAWLFPVGSNTIVLPRYDVSDFEKSSKVNNTTHSAQNKKLAEEEDDYTPVITEISFSAFLRQVELSTLDTGKLDYIYENKKLLKNKLKFSELISIINTFSLSTNKLKAVKALRSQTGLPTEEELDIYTSHFYLSTNKRKALDLIYKK